MAEICFTWDEADFCWDDNPYCWDDVCIIEEILGNGALDYRFEPWFQQWQKDNKKKKKRIITLLTTIDGTTYKDTAEVDDVTLELSDIKLIANDMRRYGINIDVKSIEFK